MQLSAREDRRDREQCPLCHARLGASTSALATCASCATVSHVVCLRELSDGVCPIQGCARAIPVPERTKARAWWRLSPVVAVVAALAVIGGVVARERIEPPEHDHDHVHPRPDIFPGPEEQPAPIDLSHVKVGQRYMYRLMPQGVPTLVMEMIYEVVEVGENRVRYTTQVSMDMGQGLAPVGDPQPTEWKHDPRYPGEGFPPTLVRERLEVGGVTFDAIVVESGTTRSWIPVRGDRPTFPGILKTTTDGQVTMELVGIGGR